MLSEHRGMTTINPEAHMNRTAWLAAMALILAPGRGSGQAGAVSGDDDPPRAVGFRMVGAFGGGGQGETFRQVRLEMQGGQKLEGTIRFLPVIVDGDLGRYTILPDKIETIQFLGRANADDDGQQGPPTIPQGMRGGGMRMNPMQRVTLVRGKVTTTTGKIILGDVHIPPNFALELDFGTLAVAPEKLRTLTMIEAEPAQAPANDRPTNPKEQQPGARPAPANSGQKTQGRGQPDQGGRPSQKP